MMKMNPKTVSKKKITKIVAEQITTCLVVGFSHPIGANTKLHTAKLERHKSNEISNGISIYYDRGR